MTGKTFSALLWLGVETRHDAEDNGTFFSDLYVPSHTLSSEIQREARKHGMPAYTELGCGQELNGKPVCANGAIPPV